MIKKETATKYNFLKNEPLGEDLFENKSQDKTANVISEKVINDPEFKIIGIDGEWGSGKSNLIRLLENKLKESHEFFVYDVWGHQEDEQRKAILVELTDFIKDKSGLLKKGNKKNWDDKLKVLLAKSKETTTINQPYLSVGFIFSLLSIVYVPTVNVFKDSMVDFLNIDSFFGKLILVTFPIIIVIGIYIYNFFKNWIKNEKFWKSFRRSAEDTFQVYTNKQKEETKIETISESQPSVRDFQRWMKDIDNDLQKPIVIVFDNFDRLPKKHILSIWSSIHMFFAEESYSKIKVIIPFDREHVQNAFKDLNSDENKFGDDYVNKTFDIVFRITLPIMSNWKKFFEEQWQKAVGKENEEEMRLVIQVYEFLNHRITPREIISFINEILTIKLLDNNFKERYIAIFVLKKNEILENPLKAVTDFKEILGGLFQVYSNDKNYAKQLTAIIYHIEVDQALELIYTQELKESMIKNDVEKFNKICNSDFINAIFYSTMLELESFENPILTLDSINKDARVSSQNINQTWNLFSTKAFESNDTINKLEIEDWRITLIKNIPNDKYLKKILGDYFNLIDDSNIEHYIDVIDDISIDLTEERVLRNLIKRDISATNYIKLIEYSGEGFSKFKLSTDYKLLDEYLGELDIDKILEFEKTKFLPKDYDFKNYKDLLKTNLNSFVDRNEVQSADNILIKIKERSQKNGDLKDLLKDSRIYNLYQNKSSSKLPIINELIAMRIAKGSKFSSSYVSRFNSILNTENDERADEIANTILNYTNYEDLLLSSNEFKSNPLFKQIIQNIFNKNIEELGETPDLSTLLEKYSEIKDNLQIDNHSLLKEFNKWSVDKEKLDLVKLDEGFINDCLSNSDLRLSKDFLKTFNDNFKNLDEESYEVVFNEGKDVYFKYFEHIESSSLTQKSLDVFENKLIEKLRSNSKINPKRWSILQTYDSNNSNISVLNTFKNILDEILTARIVLNSETAKNILPYLIKYELLDEKESLFRLIIKNEFLSDSGFIQLLIDHSENIKTLYRNAQKEDKDGFRNLLNEKREDDELIETLAKKLDIRKVKRNKDVDE